MKNYVIFFLTTFLIVGCNSSDNKKVHNPQNDSIFNYSDEVISIKSINFDEYENYSGIKFENLDKSNLIKKKQDSLLINLDDNTTIIFTDTLVNTDDSEIRMCEHGGDIGNYHFISINFYESAYYFLINKINGKKYELVGEPLISPNKKYIISFCSALDYSQMTNGIQVWKIENEILLLQAAIYPSDFQIEEARWIEDGKLAVQIGFNSPKKAYGILSFPL